MKRCLLVFSFLCSFPLFSQVINGKIIDAESKQSIPFAVIVISNTNRGTTADLDGTFSLSYVAGDEEITVQVVGYERKRLKIADFQSTSANIIKLTPANIGLTEVVVRPGINPAEVIIRKLIEKKPLYDIANLNYYSCKTYAKTYFTLSDREGDENFYEKDTVQFRKIKGLLAKQYLFFMESVTEKKYVYKGISQEKVLSSRVSGFKAAPFGAFASQLQSFTFYSDNIELLGVKYISPITAASMKRYNFEITDTVRSGGDTTLLIRFYPKRNTSFNAMKGMLYVNKNNYALSNVIAEPSEIKEDGTGIRVQQLYEKVDSLHWFPKQANTELLFYSAAVGAAKENSKKETIMKGVSRLYTSEIKLDSVVKIKDKSVVAYNAEGYENKDESFWNKYRKDSLDEKEKKTYQTIDSIGSKAKFDQKLKWFVALTSGKWNLGYIDIDLKHIVKVNDYESVRLGLGLSTSNRLSRWFSVGAYAGYGFRDQALKYGGSARVNFNRRQSNYFLMEAAHEITESAGTAFLQEAASMLNPDNIRPLLISRMDKVDYARASLNFSVFNVLKTSLYSQVQLRESPFGFYRDFAQPTWQEEKKFVFNETGIQLRYWPGEKFTETFGQLLSMGSALPLFSANFAVGTTNTISGYTGSFDYTKIELRMDHKISFRFKGFLAYQLQAGKVFGNVPYSLQYNNKGSRSDNYLISAEKTFETMYLNEFISTQYAAVFVSVNSGRIFKTNKLCNPELELVHNYAIGTLDNRERLTNIELNDISRGYTEAGLRIKNLVKSGYSSFGGAVFYRYGNYAYSIAQKNLVFKLVLGFVF